MTVYVLKNEWVKDGEHGNEIMLVTSDLEKARKAMREFIDDEMETSWIADVEDVEIDENDNSWSACIDGEYSDCHTTVEITEHQLVE